MSESSFDTNRRLCPDGTCVGVIGPDGRCPECGRNASGKPDLSTVAETAETMSADASSPTADGFDPNRRLCDDGACVGVVGPDGRCAVCGTPAG